METKWKTWLSENHNGSVGFDSLEETGSLVIPGFIDPEELNKVNKALLSCLDATDLKSKNLPGLKMGNLAINSCYLHQHLWELLKDSGLIGAIVGHFETYKYVSFGGNLNLPGSRRQRLHIDSRTPNLTVNIPLVDVTEKNGAVSIIDTPLNQTHSTLDVLRGRLFCDAKPLCSRQGDVVLRFASTWHRGNANRSENPRMMLSFTLRDNWPWKDNDSPNSELIFEKQEDKAVQFSGNIYPATRVGRVLENFDFAMPTISMNALHIRNIFRGR
jgi:hypothetical protein